MQQSNISTPLTSTAPKSSPYLLEQQSHSLQKHPLLGLWNPIWQGWLVNDVKEVTGDSDIWTTEFNEAQTFRTESAANNARKHLRDFYDIDVCICVLNYD